MVECWFVLEERFPMRQMAYSPDQLPQDVAGRPASKDFVQFGSSENTALVVVPTYNEALNIERLLAEILAQGSHFDVLVVDDNSPDGTGDIVERIARDTPRVQLHRRP